MKRRAGETETRQSEEKTRKKMVSELRVRLFIYQQPPRVI